MADHPRRPDGDETWHRLLDWTKGQKASERLAAHILRHEGYKDIDPSHPQGGKDGGKDLTCRKDDLKLIAACYFPRGQQSFTDIKDKFADDVRGIAKNQAAGIVFVTNQELRLAERKELIDLNTTGVTELYHLERLTSLLNTPANYGVRREYLAMGITEEEYISFITDRDRQHFQRLEALDNKLAQVSNGLEAQTSKMVGLLTGGETVAYFLPAHPVGSQTIHLALFIDSTEFPAYDITGHYIDLDEPTDPQNGHFWTMHQFYFASLFPAKCIMPAFSFDMRQRTRLRLQLSYHTRTVTIQQRLLAHKDGDNFLFAFKVEANGKTFKVDINPAFPGYNPDDPEALLR